MSHTHPNDHWFANRENLPQPRGHHVSILVPLATLLFGAALISMSGQPTLAVAVALASGLGCGWVQRNGRA